MFQLVKIDRCMSPWILCWAPADVSWNVCPRRRFYYRFQYPTHSTSSLLLLFQRVNWLVIYMVGYCFKFDNSYHQNIFANIITWRKRMRISCFGCANIRYNNFAFFYPRKKNINIWILLRYRNIFLATNLLAIQKLSIYLCITKAHMHLHDSWHLVLV